MGPGTWKLAGTWKPGPGTRKLGHSAMEHGVSHPAQSLVDVNCNESVIRIPQELLFSLQ